jgi:adenosylcobinamide kinase / adenosylcobinamide-phosphate guanylyltransferase
MMRELIIGGQKSGKSRRAEDAARAWLAQAGGRRAILLATALRHDEETTQRIARHQHDRARRCPQLQLLEEPLHLAAAIRQNSSADTLLIVDCLTMWLTNLMMPASPPVSVVDLHAQVQQLHATVSAAAGPLVLVTNEIGLGVIPLGREVRSFLDTLGSLNQQLAHACDRVTLMVAGQALTVKSEHA